MIRRVVILGMRLVFAGASFAAVAQGTAAVNQDLVKQGGYLARAADCAACHTVPHGGKPFAGGYAIQSPLGTIYSTNITPSKTAGIGEWSEAQFARAVREGVAADGHHLYPAMPYDAYSGITDNDIHALYLYFTSTVAPVDDAPAKTTQLKFPFNVRYSMAAWNALFLNHQRFQSGTQDPTLARGRYLVDVLGHCSSCHTPRNTLMANKPSAYLGGADIGGWYAPNITSDPVSGVGGWSTAELVGFLKNGHVQGKAVAAGGMAEAVENSLRHLTDADLQAMSAYLKTVPPLRTPGQTKAAYDFGKPVQNAYSFDTAQSLDALDAADQARARSRQVETQRSNVAGVTDGAILYDSACASCHQPSGAGTADNYYPSLYHSSAVGAAKPNNLVMTILEGVHRTGADGGIAMPAFKRDMDDAQVAAVANFVAQHFGNADMQVSTADVTAIRGGGKKPALLMLAPYIVPVMIIGLLLLGWVSTVLVRRRKPASR